MGRFVPKCDLLVFGADCINFGGNESAEKGYVYVNKSESVLACLTAKLSGIKVVCLGHSSQVIGGGGKEKKNLEVWESVGLGSGWEKETQIHMQETSGEELTKDWAQFEGLEKEVRNIDFEKLPSYSIDSLIIESGPCEFASSVGSN